MSTPAKTGCQVYIEEYGLYAIGDAFEVAPSYAPKEVYYFRLNNNTSREPVRDRLHFRIKEINDWFDMDGPGTSTLVALDADYLGYEGEEIPQ